MRENIRLRAALGIVGLVLLCVLPASAEGPQLAQADPLVVGPDLVITDVWLDAADICYQIVNRGDAVAPPGHGTALLLDGRGVTQDVVGQALSPGQRLHSRTCRLSARSSR